MYKKKLHGFKYLTVLRIKRIIWFIMTVCVASPNQDVKKYVSDILFSIEIALCATGQVV